MLQSVHVQVLKLHSPREPDKEVRRVTTVLEPDSKTDTMEHQYTEVTLSGTVEAETKEADVLMNTEIFLPRTQESPT